MVTARTACLLVATVLAGGCGTRSEPPRPTPPADPVAAVLCPLASAATTTDAAVAALSKRAEQAQKDVASQVFDSKYRAMSTAAFALNGAASGLASLNVQVPESQRTASASSEPFSRFRRGLEQAQQNLTTACGEFQPLPGK